MLHNKNIDMDKLISNTDFGSYVRELDINDHKKLELRENYDSFLKQPLTLGMFVSCDSDGNVFENIQLTECSKKCPFKNDYKTCCEHKDTYEAISRVLFKDFEIETLNIKENITAEILKLDKCRVFWKDGGGWNKSGLHNTIEDLVKYNLVLTESAKKQIGL